MRFRPTVVPTSVQVHAQVYMLEQVGNRSEIYGETFYRPDAEDRAHRAGEQWCAKGPHKRLYHVRRGSG